MPIPTIIKQTFSDADPNLKLNTTSIIITSPADSKSNNDQTYGNLTGQTFSCGVQTSTSTGNGKIRIILEYTLIDGYL